MLIVLKQIQYRKRKTLQQAGCQIMTLLITVYSKSGLKSSEVNCFMVLKVIYVL